MGDSSYWDAQGHRFTPRGASHPVASVPPVRRARPARPSRAVVRQLLTLLHV